jgi:hypothetical protein
MALMFAKQYPNAHVTALDISADQYPPVWSRPRNTTFGLWNIFDDVPEIYVGRFDVVHVRAIAGPLIGKDKGPVVDRFARMLSAFPLQNTL